jgi:hypothetical protein
MVKVIPSELTAECIGEAKLFANRNDLLANLSIGSQPTVAEIGVAFGDFSEFIITRKRPKKFVAFDLFELHHIPVIWGKPSAEVFLGRTHREYFEQRMAKYGEVQIDIVQGDSSVRLADYPDQSFDMIYIDGDHTYDGVRRDADVSTRKLKNSGKLVFNDYVLFDHLTHDEYGIVQVVNEMCLQEGWQICGFAFQQSMFCDVALERRTA